MRRRVSSFFASVIHVVCTCAFVGCLVWAFCWASFLCFMCVSAFDFVLFLSWAWFMGLSLYYVLFG